MKLRIFLYSISCNVIAGRFNIHAIIKKELYDIPKAGKQDGIKILNIKSSL